jgi:hypothetical protein
MSPEPEVEAVDAPGEPPAEVSRLRA